MNEIDNTVKRIGQLPKGVPVFGGDLDNPPCPEIGLTTDELIAVADAYTKAVADLATAKQDSDALRAVVEGYQELLGETFKLKLDDDTEIYRGAWGYQCSELPSDESYDSIIEIWNAIKPKDAETGETK